MISSLASRTLQPLLTFVAMGWISVAWPDDAPKLGWVEYAPGQKLAIEIAATPEQRERGLMFRDNLAEGYGMLFVYPETQRLAMWMQNTLIALDAIFIAENGKIVSIQRDLQPCREQPCPVHFSKGKARYMLEVASGSAEKLNLAPGQELIIEYRHP